MSQACCHEGLNNLLYGIQRSTFTPSTCRAILCAGFWSNFTTACVLDLTAKLLLFCKYTSAGWQFVLFVFILIRINPVLCVTAKIQPETATNLVAYVNPFDLSVIIALDYHNAYKTCRLYLSVSHNCHKKEPLNRKPYLFLNSLTHQH